MSVDIRFTLNQYSDAKNWREIQPGSLITYQQDPVGYILWPVSQTEFIARLVNTSPAGQRVIAGLRDGSLNSVDTIEYNDYTQGTQQRGFCLGSQGAQKIWIEPADQELNARLHPLPPPIAREICLKTIALMNGVCDEPVLVNDPIFTAPRVDPALPPGWYVMDDADPECINLLWHKGILGTGRTTYLTLTRNHLSSNRFQMNLIAHDLDHQLVIMTGPPGTQDWNYKIHDKVWPAWCPPCVPASWLLKRVGVEEFTVPELFRSVCV